MSKIEIPGLPSEDKPLTLDPVDTPSEESKYEAPGTLIEELDPVLEAATLSQPEIPPEPQDERQKNDPPTTDALDSTNTTPSLFAPRKQAPAGIIAAGIVAILGGLAAVILGGGKHGRSQGTTPQPAGGGGSTPGPLGDDYYARLFGLK